MAAIIYNLNGYLVINQDKQLKLQKENKLPSTAALTGSPIVPGLHKTTSFSHDLDMINLPKSRTQSM